MKERTGFGFFSWRSQGLSAPGEVLDGAVVTAGIGAEGLNTLSFPPAALGAVPVWHAGGGAADRLALLYRAVEASCLRA